MLKILYIMLLASFLLPVVIFIITMQTYQKERA